MRNVLLMSEMRPLKDRVHQSAPCCVEVSVFTLGFLTKSIFTSQNWCFPYLWRIKSGIIFSFSFLWHFLAPVVRSSTTHTVGNLCSAGKRRIYLHFGGDKQWLEMLNWPVVLFNQIIYVYFDLYLHFMNTRHQLRCNLTSVSYLWQKAWKIPKDVAETQSLDFIQLIFSWNVSSELI